MNEALRGGFGRLWDIDHIVPLADDGTSEMENLRTLCVKCHHQVTKAYNDKRKELECQELPPQSI